MSAHDQDQQQSWPVLIGAMVLLKGQLAGMSPDFPFIPPRLGAGEGQIAAVEERWGPLEADYRDFLGHVDGWEGFWAGAALLDTASMCREANAAALELYYEQCELEDEDLVLEHVMPLGTPNSLDWLAMMGRSGTPLAGQVIDWAPSSGGRYFPTFRAYFLDTLAAYERYIQGKGARPVTYADHGLEGLTGGIAGPGPGDAQALARLLVHQPTEPWPWASLVRAVGGLKSVLAARGHGEVWGAPAPGGASDEQLYAVRQRWGVHLDPQHADLLRAADGWPQLMISIDLLSTDQLASRERMVPAVAHLRAVMEARGRDAGEFLVLASSAEDEDGRDTVVVSRATGKVSWLRGDQVQRDYDDVRAWIINVIGHHLTEINTTPDLLHSPL